MLIIFFKNGFFVYHIKAQHLFTDNMLSINKKNYNNMGYT